MEPADRYSDLLGANGHLRESAVAPADEEFSEIELQARWFAGDFGRRFTTQTGDEIEVVQFGVWNREAGPDFAEAAVSINGAAPERGCIEIDPDARDWEQHGHATNRDYESVVLHVFLTRGDATFFTRTAQNRNVPQVQIDRSSAATRSPAAMPIAKLGRCMAPLRDLPADKVSEILEAASQFRLRRKSARLAALIEAHGFDEALYQSLATTLGYKSNKLPFTLIAQRLPIRVLLKNKAELEALLFGVGGFLNTTDLTQLDRDTRFYLRELWEKWWARRAEFERLAVARDLWRMSGLRPANHPQRRLAALGQIVRQWPKLKAVAESLDVAGARNFFGGLQDQYWDFHFTLTSRPSPRRMALVGQTRVNEMLANVFFPIAMLSDSTQWTAYKKLPALLTNRRVEIAAIRLLGANPAKSELVKTAARQQGLLQIYEDFCMQDNSDCARCLFPKQLGKW